ncbi:MAG: Holliday junction ATP-dependent DNA helicase RuvA [Candidatus Magasanikbacteria bacterium GW2011_GWC2_40_17]|uniref:Holliday junction branch migration complex subunit RuvA n=1 Tax=Candidatus Magasanikbacteria bacterium GW2011_GWA2_42_32 TaxID=1619039 RepID=A0A0G1A8P4_9BACT|nr:MAG: Holliday junction ATP-dependent DNA helicase RuvA [Candidatus Magasanikbacteria bacterium GW2011_GWC2_40_17]KKS57294.1 MAG: Holliday junction ATP-dependent DNA helicase RuvA [Candidatus Magasanikbacteria bacterium GW2011_GWA2_42_32]OGH86180.1 MAG: Holliday junction DNA helicase RuvA [Candidatus Magasanikbacteria bacterium RIFOXYB2_FULL_38_10]
MISYLSGKVLAKGKNYLVVFIASGLGYEVKVSPALLLKAKIGEELVLYTYLNVHEDAQELFGVETWEELEFLKMLVAVNGVGPKSALNILALGAIEEIKNAIVHSDLTFLTKVSGIGKKIAERIIVELKEKIKTDKNEVGEGKTSSGKLGDVIDALTGLGYSAAEARAALNKVNGENEDVSKILKAALKELNRK